VPKRLPLSVHNGGIFVAVMALSVVAACSGDDQPEPPAPTPAATSAFPAASTGPYDATDLSLCTATDLTPLDALGLTEQKTDPKPPPSAPGSACLFTMKTAAGHAASLRVEASTPESTEQAELLYRSTSSVTDLIDEGPVADLGEEADGFSGQSTAAGEKTTEYLVHARTGNLVLKTFLTVGGSDYPSKASLAEPCRQITAGMMLLVTKN
jgi:hypothetical protein